MLLGNIIYEIGLLLHNHPFDLVVTQKTLFLKHSHPGWETDWVLVELIADQELATIHLPNHNRLTVYFKQVCLECVIAS